MLQNGGQEKLYFEFNFMRKHTMFRFYQRDRNSSFPQSLAQEDDVIELVNGNLFRNALRHVHSRIA